MQLHHVLVRENVVAVHLLAVELRATPDARELEALGDLLVDVQGEVVDRRPLGEDERPPEVGLFPRLLAEDANSSEVAEQDLAKVLEPRAGESRDGEEGEVRADRLAREGRERPVVVLALVAEDEDGLRLEEGRRVSRKRPRARPDAGAREEVVEEPRGLVGAVGPDVHDEKDAVRVVREVREVRLRVALGDGRRVDELHLHVLELRHPGQRDARRERVVADLGVGVREGREERGLAGVRRPEEDPLAGPLALDVADLDPVAVAPARRERGLVLELREALAQVGQQLLGALVLREKRDHLAQRRELLRVVRGFLESRFGVVVLRGQVRGHVPRIWAAP